MREDSPLVVCSKDTIGEVMCSPLPVFFKARVGRCKDKGYVPVSEKVNNNAIIEIRSLGDLGI
jgi:hypothetical protein